MKCTVYILQSSSTKRFYTGQTLDLSKRLAEHNSELAGHTKKEQPWKVVWFQAVKSRKEAMNLEQKIKRRGAKRFINDLKEHSSVSVTPQA